MENGVDMPKNINTGKVKQTPAMKVETATEYAYDALTKKAIHDKIIPDKGQENHLEFNPSLELAQKFKDVCREVLVSLGYVEEKAPEELPSDKEPPDAA